MIYFDNDYAQISWDEELKCVVGRWKKFAIGDNFRLPLEKCKNLSHRQKL